jgi:hypothetical protein
MTKKHYEAIASIIEYYAHDTTVYNALANRLADYFAQDNPKFDRQRFLKACGIEVDKHSGGYCNECMSTPCQQL